jgi:membrane associated rhomboid family serine protease
LLEAGTKRCPYCETGQGSVLAPSPDEDARRTGTLAIWLLGACLVVYMLSVVLDPARGDREGSSMEPSMIGRVMIGASVQHYVNHCGQVWRYVSSVFVHHDLLHLLFNCVALFVVMPLAGASFGVHRSWVMFLATGVFASIVSGFGAPPYLAGAGASGAICGLIAALFIYGRRRKGIGGAALSRRMLTWGIFILAYGFFMNRFGGPLGNISNVAHIAGFASGAGFGWIASGVRARGGREDRIWGACAHLCTGLVIATSVFVAINVWHGQERREVLLFSGSVHRAMSYLARPVDGEGAARRRPNRLDEAPANGDEVRDAVNRAIQLDEERAPRSKQIAAIREAGALWRAWQVRVKCSHQLRFDQ